MKLSIEMDTPMYFMIAPFCVSVFLLSYRFPYFGNTGDESLDRTGNSETDTYRRLSSFDMSLSCGPVNRRATHTDIQGIISGRGKKVNLGGDKVAIGRRACLVCQLAVGMISLCITCGGRRDC